MHRIPLSRLYPPLPKSPRSSIRTSPIPTCLNPPGHPLFRDHPLLPRPPHPRSQPPRGVAKSPTYLPFISTALRLVQRHWVKTPIFLFRFIHCGGTTSQRPANDRILVGILPAIRKCNFESRRRTHIFYELSNACLCTVETKSPPGRWTRRAWGWVIYRVFAQFWITLRRAKFFAGLPGVRV